MIKSALKFIFILFFLSLIFVPSKIFAKNSRSSISLPAGSSIDGDYFAFSENVTISGSINGDLYTAGAVVVIDGKVTGDVLVVGGVVTIDGEVVGNVRAMGGTINLNGRVGKNVSLVGGNLHLGSNTIIDGNLVSVFGNLEYLGQVSGKMKVVGGNVSLNGQAGSVEAKVESLTLSDNAKILGDLTYTSKQEAVVSPQAYVGGTTNYTFGSFSSPFIGKDFTQKTVSFVQKILKGVSLVGFLTSLLVGFLLLKIFPRLFVRMSEVMMQRPFRSLGIGFLIFLFTPFIILLLIFSIIGIPIAMIYLFALMIYLYFAKIFVGYYIGFRIFKDILKSERRGWALFVGMVLLFLLSNLPIVGWLVKIAILMIGLGAWVILKVRIYRYLCAKKIL